MISPRGIYMHNTAGIIPDLENIRNADMNELSEITRTFSKINMVSEGKG